MSPSSARSNSQIVTNRICASSRPHCAGIAPRTLLVILFAPRRKRYGAFHRSLGRLFLTIFFISAPGSTLANPFDFGFSSSITVVANVDVLIPAAIINRGDTAIDFDCAAAACGAFGLLVQAGPGEGLNALNFEFLFPASQFAGLILESNERFDFIFGKISFDPSVSIGNPFGTILHPTFTFRLDNSDTANLTSTISIGVETAFSPLAFVASTPGDPLPETVSALLYLVLGFLATMATIAWRKRG